RALHSFPTRRSSDLKNKESEDDLYHLKTKEIITQVKKQGFEFGDICIITRKNQDGFSLADYLTQQGIPIISSESLLLNNNRKIRSEEHTSELQSREN